MKNKNAKEFEKKIYKTPHIQEIGRVVAYTKNQGIGGPQDNGSTQNPTYSS